MNLDSAINLAAGNLPEGFELILSIENGGYGASVRYTSGSFSLDVEIEADTLIDSIVESVDMAKDMAPDYVFSKNDTQETAEQLSARHSVQVKCSRQEASIAIGLSELLNLESSLGRRSEEFGKYRIGDKNYYVVSIANIDYIFKQA